jgi:hypothetical protein
MPRLIPLLFIKSHIKGYTRKDGTYVQDHDDKRQKKPYEPHGSAQGYGTHNIEHGDTVHFQAGEFKGSGRPKTPATSITILSGISMPNMGPIPVQKTTGTRTTSLSTSMRMLVIPSPWNGATSSTRQRPRS